MQNAEQYEAHMVDAFISGKLAAGNLIEVSRAYLIRDADEQLVIKVSAVSSEPLKHVVCIFNIVGTDTQPS